MLSKMGVYYSIATYLVMYLYFHYFVSLGTLVPNSRDQQVKLWLLKKQKMLRKQPYNKISFTYKP